MEILSIASDSCERHVLSKYQSVVNVSPQSTSITAERINALTRPCNLEIKASVSATHSPRCMVTSKYIVSGLSVTLLSYIVLI